MRILKKLALFVALVVALLLVIALFVTKEYAVEREVVINKSETEVFNFIKMVKNQDHFSVWNKKDPGMKKEFKGNDGEVGFVSSWESANKEVGKGEQEIVNLVTNERIDFKLRFKEPFEAEDDAYFVTEEINANQTRVKWGFKGTMPYPMNLLLLMMDMEKELGGALQTGLDDLKKYMEQ